MQTRYPCRTHVSMLAGFIFCICLTAPHSHAQFDRLLSKTTDKLAREVERMAVEKISDVIAEKAAQEIEKEFDKLLMEAMAEDSARYDRDSAYYALGNSYGKFLEGLNDAADLPESYTFDLSILYEVVSGNDKPENMRYFFSRSEPIFAIQTATSETQWQFIVIDVGNDVTVMYQHDGEEKTAQAIPNMMKLAGSMASSYNSELDEEFDYEIEKLPGKKRFAGYKCEGWKGTNKNANETQSFEAWLTEDLGIDWKQSFGGIMQQFSSSATFQTWEGMEGTIMMSRSYDAKEKMSSSMEATEVDKKAFTLENADYTFGYQ